MGHPDLLLYSAFLPRLSETWGTQIRFKILFPTQAKRGLEWATRGYVGQFVF